MPSVSQARPAFVSVIDVPPMPGDLLTQWTTPKNITIAHIEAWRDAAPAKIIVAHHAWACSWENRGCGGPLRHRKGKFDQNYFGTKSDKEGAQHL
jgi:hypothetical protein